MLKQQPYRKAIFSFGSPEDFVQAYSKNPERVCVSLAKFVTGKRKRSAVNRLLALPEAVILNYALSIGFIHTLKDPEEIFN